MTSPLRSALLNEAVRQGLIEFEPVEIDLLKERPEPGVPAFRQELRLLLKATVDLKLAQPYQRFSNDLRRIPWANSRDRAFRAATRLMEIAAWSSEDEGDEVAGIWEEAARVAEILGEDYNGWRHETYEAIAATFFGAAMGSFNEPIFRTLLASLKGT